MSQTSPAPHAPWYLTEMVQTQQAPAKFLYILEKHSTADMKIAWAAVSSLFSADLHLLYKLIFSALFFLSGLHLFIHLSGRWKRSRRQRLVSGSEDVVSDWQPFSQGLVYRKQVGQWRGYIPPLNTVCLHVKLSNLPFVSVCVRPKLLSHLYCLLSHSPHPPHPSLIDCLFITGPAAATVLIYEIVMVIVIFCGGERVRGWTL